MADRSTASVRIVLQYCTNCSPYCERNHCSGKGEKNPESVSKRETKIMVSSRYRLQKTPLRGWGQWKKSPFRSGNGFADTYALSVFYFSIQTPLRVSNKRKFDHARTTRHTHAVFYIIIQYYIYSTLFIAKLFSPLHSYENGMSQPSRPVEFSRRPSSRSHTTGAMCLVKRE